MRNLTPAGRILAEEIERSGPIPFSRFMEIALYHPEYGYYRKSRDPFGRAGDFYTAEQIQPVFGRLIRSVVLKLALALGKDAAEITVVELGAGRQEMAEVLHDFNYIPVDLRYGEMPRGFTGIVFSNEFFDALPVDVVISRGGRRFERRVSVTGEHFIWVDGPETLTDIVEPAGVRSEDDIRETHTAHASWLEQISRALCNGFVLTIDYGYTQQELLRFPEGTLMSYRHHQPIPDVLSAPGEQDITAHVPFTYLQKYGAEVGLETVAFETLSRTLLRAGEADEFASAIAADSEEERLRNKLQLKTLLFGMGETFRTLLQRRRAK